MPVYVKAAGRTILHDLLRRLERIPVTITTHPKTNGYSMKQPERLFIGGEWRTSAKGARIDVISPTDENVAGQVAAATPEDIDLAVAAARDLFDNGPWPRMAPAERAAVLRKAAAKLRERLSDTAWITTLEMGAPLEGVDGVSLFLAERGAVNNVADKLIRQQFIRNLFSSRSSSEQMASAAP